MAVLSRLDHHHHDHHDDHFMLLPSELAEPDNTKPVINAALHSTIVVDEIREGLGVFLFEGASHVRLCAGESLSL